MFSWMFFLGWIQAAELQGVSLPDAVDVSGETLVLNGMGLRTKYGVFKIYVGGLYLPQKTMDGHVALEQGGAKRVTMHFVRSLSASTLASALGESIDRSAHAAALEAEKERFVSWIEDMEVGDEVTLTYVPGSGTTVEIHGAVKGRIPGELFMEAIFSMFVGEQPAQQGLKRGLLGG